MFTGQGQIVVGYRWITRGGKSACRQCAALDGQEFYLRPAHGQRSLEDMPQPPLHPHCGCELQEILDVGQLMRERLRASGGEQAFAYFAGGAGGQEPAAPLADPGEEGQARPAGAAEATGPDMPDDEERDGDGKPSVEVFKDSIFGLSWRRGYISNGPIYGYYCGDRWSKGRDTRSDEYKKIKKATAIDSLDQACAIHDAGYDGPNKKAADRKLAAALDRLRKVDPRKWEKPPPADKIAEAQLYCYLAWLLFQGRVTKYDQDERDPQEWGYDAEGLGDQ